MYETEIILSAMAAGRTYHRVTGLGYAMNVLTWLVWEAPTESVEINLLEHHLLIDLAPFEHSSRLNLFFPGINHEVPLEIGFAAGRHWEASSPADQDLERLFELAKLLRDNPKPRLSVVGAVPEGVLAAAEAAGRSDADGCPK